jgi:hypothetical protein
MYNIFVRLLSMSVCREGILNVMSVCREGILDVILYHNCLSAATHRIIAIKKFYFY